MPLNAILTVGWKDYSTQEYSARKLHDTAEDESEKSTECLRNKIDDLYNEVEKLENELENDESKKSEYEDRKKEHKVKTKDYEDEKRDCYKTSLFQQLQQLQSVDKPIIIYATEQLFRRNINGFGSIKKFVASLILIVTKENGFGDVYCLMDVFSYAFLKGAKNIDFQLPERKDDDFPDEVAGLDLYRNCEKKWNKKDIPALEEFERTGKRLPQKFIITEKEYLRLRSILTRGSARDEQRSLATLLVSGPSTMKEISDDLGLNYSLGDRVLGVFVDNGIVRAWKNGKYVIFSDKLPAVIFFLREIMGLDYLRSLQEDIRKWV